MNKYIGTKIESRFTKYFGKNSKVPPPILAVIFSVVFSLVVNLVCTDLRMSIRAFQSPMDKQTCQEYAQANAESSKFRWDIGPLRITFYNPVDRKSEYCRYIN